MATAEHHSPAEGPASFLDPRVAQLAPYSEYVRKWLGVHMHAGTTFYDLLGIPPTEYDDEVISNAADKQTLLVRTKANGNGHSQDASQKILNAIASARVTLLNPAKRQQYDARILQAVHVIEINDRGVQHRVESPLPAYEVTRSPIAINTGDDGSSSDVRKRLHSNTDTAHWKYAAIIGGSAAAGTAILGGTVAMMRGGDAEDTEPKREARASMDEREMQGTTFGMPQARLRDDVPAFDPGAATEESAPAPVPVREEKPVPQDVLAPSTVQDVPVVQEEEVADARDPRRDLADLMSQPQKYPGPRRPVTEQAEDAGAQLERVQQVSAKTLAAVVQRDEQGFAKIMDTLRSEGDGVVRAGMALGAAELAAQCGRVDLLQKALQRLEQDAGAFCTRAEVMLLKADIAMHIAPASITNPMLRRKDEEAWLKNEQQRVDVARVLMDGAMGAWQMDDNAQSSAYLARARQHIFGDTSSGLSGAFVGHKAYKEQGGHARKDLEEMEAENARQAAMLEQVQALLEGGASPQNASEHQSLGEYLLLARGDWERGLPHVAQGTDRVMAEAAQRTLKGGETVEERAAVVRAWLRVAEGNERMRRVAEKAASLHMRTLKGMTLTGPEKLVVNGLEREVGGGTDTFSALQQETVVIDADGKRTEFPKGKWIELIQLLKNEVLDEPEIIKGKWQFTPLGLSSLSDTTFSRIKIAEITGSYDLQIIFDVYDGKEGLAVSLPVGSTSVTLVVDGWNPPKTYLSHVNGKSPLKIREAVEGKIVHEGRNTYEISVRNFNEDQAIITVGANGTLLFQWKGSTEELSEDPSWTMPTKQSLGVGTNCSKMSVASVKLKLHAQQGQ